MQFIAGMMYFLLAVLSASVWADCQVLLPEGAVRYEGGCNGSLAHGQGRAYVRAELIRMVFTPEILYMANCMARLCMYSPEEIRRL